MATSTTIKPFDSMKVEITEYDPLTGNVLRKLDSLHLGITALEKYSHPIVVKMNVKGTKRISNIRLSIIDSSIDISGSGTKYSDNSVPNGNVGIEHSLVLSEKNSLIKFFNGKNNSSSPSSSNNILIQNSTDTESEYIYLNVQSTDSIHRGYIIYKWFFEFA